MEWEVQENVESGTEASGKGVRRQLFVGWLTTSKFDYLFNSSALLYQLLHGGWDDPSGQDLENCGPLGEKESSLCRYESHMPWVSGTVGFTECCPLSDHES